MNYNEGYGVKSCVLTLAQKARPFCSFGSYLDILTNNFLPLNSGVMSKRKECR